MSEAKASVATSGMLIHHKQTTRASLQKSKSSENVKHDNNTVMVHTNMLLKKRDKVRQSIYILRYILHAFIQCGAEFNAM